LAAATGSSARLDRRAGRRRQGRPRQTPTGSQRHADTGDHESLFHGTAQTCHRGLEAILARHDAQSLTDEQFDIAFGDLQTEDEG
jgi:hypothetical protein